MKHFRASSAAESRCHSYSWRHIAWLEPCTVGKFHSLWLGYTFGADSNSHFYFQPRPALVINERQLRFDNRRIAFDRNHFNVVWRLRFHCHHRLYFHSINFFFDRHLTRPKSKRRLTELVNTIGFSKKETLLHEILVTLQQIWRYWCDLTRSYHPFLDCILRTWCKQNK